MAREEYVIITGAAGGIGKATVKYLYERDYKLVLVDLQRIDISEYAKDRVYAFSLDLTNLTSVTGFIKMLKTENIRISALVHMAAITRDKSILNMERAEWLDVINTNLNGTFYIIQEAGKYLRELRYTSEFVGKIVLLGSTAARHGNYGQLNYVASKSAIEGMTRTAAREFAKFDVRVNCVIPGFIKTPMSDMIPEPRKKQLLDQIPMKRAGTPKEIAQVIEFLISDRSSYITGTTIQVDGGLRM